MKAMRVAMVVVALGGLGCSGLVQQIQDIAKTEVKTGADAKAPADFPLAPPDGGTIQTSVHMDVAGMDTTVVAYQTDGDVAAMLDGYEKAMKDHNLQTSRSDSGGSQVLTGMGDQGSEIWTVSVADSDGHHLVSLTVAKKH